MHQESDHARPISQKILPRQVAQPVQNLPLLPANRRFLLAVPMRVCHLPVLHAREHVGDDLQRHYLAVPGLRQVERIRKPVIP